MIRGAVPTISETIESVRFTVYFRPESCVLAGMRKSRLLALIAVFPLWLALATGTGSAAQVDYFLKIDGVPGEATDDGHKDWINLLSFSQSISRSVDPTSGGGGGSSVAQFEDVQFTKYLDKATPLLMLHCANGQHIREAILVCRKAGNAGEEPVEYYKITMTDILVTSVSTGGSAGDSVPTETLSLNFSKIEWEYVPQSADGTTEPPIKTGWDLKLNQQP